jgi:hypothetical protein
MGKIRLSSHTSFYVLYSFTKNQVKVGVTNDFDHRYKTLCNANGEDLSQIFVVDCAVADQLEALVQGLLFHKWVQHGEWFHFERYHMIKIYRLMQGLFLNPSCLAVYRLDEKFAYWQNSILLTHWGISLDGPATVNCNSTADQQVTL